MNQIMMFKSFPFIYEQVEKTDISFEQSNKLTMKLLELPINPTHNKVDINNGESYHIYTGIKITPEEATKLIKTVINKRQNKNVSFAPGSLLYWDKGDIIVLKEINVQI